MNSLLAELQKRNLASRAEWARFARHRARVMALLAGEPAGHKERLCVLGAGNGNDLDLCRLAALYEQIHLVDWDSSALEWSVQHQSPPAANRIVLHGGVELTGIGSQLAEWRRGGSPDREAPQSCLQAASAMTCSSLPGLCDTAASVCLLSQLIESVSTTLGPDHPGFLPLLQALRQRHLRLLVELTRPGGRFVLITDVVSSDTAAGLAGVPEKSLPATLRQLIAEHNFFTGLNPFVLLNLYHSDLAIAPHVTDVRLEPPWLWDFGPRVYAVCAITARRVGV